MNRSLLLGSTGSILSALLVTIATAQEAYYPVAYGEAAAPAAAAPAPAATEGLATAGAENSGEPVYYQHEGLLAGPLGGPEPWTLSPKDSKWKVGGWEDAGYTTGSDGITNTRPDKLSLNQSALWVERTADGNGGLDWGFRADILYGTDGRFGQSFGNPAGTWDFDNGWDHGAYAWCMPQLYGTVAYENLNVKFGHFLTPMGYEVVPGPGNFFYSHSYAFAYSEPISHTGAIADYAVSEDFHLIGGWTAGWDTGFDQFNGSSSFIGGFSDQIFDRLKMTYLGMGGNFGWRGDGYMHSLVFDYKISERWNYVMQSDLVQSSGAFVVQPDGSRPFESGVNGDNYGINQYLFYKINCKLTTGVRAEWWKGDGVSFYEVTYGVNYKPVPNLCLRPEVRHQWSPSAADDFEDNTVFGIDGYVTF